MEYIVHGSKNQNDSKVNKSLHLVSFKLLSEDCSLGRFHMAFLV